nr:uncharacterized protein LOC128691672 [Cherax quadricarinatus]
MHYFTNNSVSANMSSAARTEETQRLSYMSRTEVVRLIVGGLGIAVCVVLVIGAVIAVGLYTTQANRILILTVVAVSAAAILLLCYIKPSCLKQGIKDFTGIINSGGNL